ncbi:MAG: hypothetical protein U9R32_00635, partial [Bacteroidota bacterium]|nr:hypothetical protein [Bacteroidota bacterium]
EIPVLHIIGSQTDIKFLNALKTGQKIENINNSYNQPTANVNEQFTLFTLSESTKSWIKNTPPLTVPFGDYSVAPSLNTLLFQQIGNIKTQKPLITLSGNGNKKTGIINGTGIWKWRMQDYIDNNNHEHFNSFISKIVQYLSIRKEKGRFRIEHNKTYLQSEQAVFYAELYNKSYKLINDSDVSIHLYKSDSIDYEFTFDKTDKKYRLDAGNLPEGIYSFVATTKQGGKTFSKTGKFVVSAIRKEQLNTTANHKLLKQLAEQNDGEMHRVNEISKLKDLLLNTNAQPVVYNDKSYNLLLNNSWALILIIFTLSLEWFLRKYNGGY